jgi:hypothetical protein
MVCKQPTLAAADFWKNSSEVYFAEFILQQQRGSAPSERAMFSIWISVYTRVALVRSLGAINKRFCWTGNECYALCTSLLIYFLSSRENALWD